MSRRTLETPVKEVVKDVIDNHLFQTITGDVLQRMESEILLEIPDLYYVSLRPDDRLGVIVIDYEFL